MGLKDKIGKNETAVFAFYNTVNQENKGVRDSIGITVDPEDLKNNIEDLITSGFEPTSIQDIMDGNAPKGSFALMACDGYDLERDDSNIIEFTKQNNIPLALSLPANLVGENKPSWTNQIEIALEEALNQNDGNKPVTFKAPGTDIEISFSSVEEAITARNTLKDLKPADIDGADYVSSICDALTHATQSNAPITPTVISNSVFDKKMTWDQVKDLSAQGVDIVTHGHAHTNPYTNLSNQEITSDINQAKKVFQEKANVIPNIMTYPEGKHDDRVTTVLKNAGITAAFTLTEGTITPNTDRMALPRITVTQDMLEM